MNICLRAKIFNTDASSEETSKKLLHWKRTLKGFLKELMEKPIEKNLTF